MASFVRKGVEFQQGFGIVVFRILTSGFTALRAERAKYLLKFILITVIVIYIITIPTRISLLLLQIIMSTLSFSNLATILMNRRLSITFLNIFMDSVWYIPLFVLFLSRSLGLFTTTPFDHEMMNKNELFGTRLLNADTKQSAFTGMTFLLKRIIALLLVSMITIASRLIPGIRILISLSILLYLHYRKKSNYKATLIPLSVSLLMSNWTIKVFLSVAKLYLTAQTLSREFMYPYFRKITLKMEEKDKKNHQWLLFGFGSAMTFCFAIPIFGLILYPVFQCAAVDILMLMIKQKKLSFKHIQLNKMEANDDHKEKMENEDEVKRDIYQRKSIDMDDIKMEEPPTLPSSLTETYNDHDSLIAGIEEEMQIQDMEIEEKAMDVRICITPISTKKRKKKGQILYAEDATKLFKKINDGKRFKNGIALKKTCHIFSVAWELPDKKGRLLPSKVVKHFKQVLPSKKTVKTGKKKGKKAGNITPSLLFESKANIGDDNPFAMLDKSNTVRGHVMSSWIATEEDNERHEFRRSLMELPSKEELGLVPDALVAHSSKKSMVSQLERLISADMNRTNDEDIEKNVMKRKRAGSLTDLDLNINRRDSVELDEEIVMENEIQLLIEEKKKLREKKDIESKKKKGIKRQMTVESDFD